MRQAKSVGWMPFSKAASARAYGATIADWAGIASIQRRHHDRTEAHFLCQLAGRLLLPVVESGNQGPGSDGQPLDGRAVEHNLYQPPADAMQEAVILGLLLMAGETA